MLRDDIKAQPSVTTVHVIGHLHGEKTEDVLMLLHSASSAHRRLFLPKSRLQLPVLRIVNKYVRAHSTQTISITGNRSQRAYNKGSNVLSAINYWMKSMS